MFKTFLRVWFPFALVYVLLLVYALSPKALGTLNAGVNATYACVGVLVLLLFLHKKDYARATIFQTLSVINAIMSANMLLLYFEVARSVFLIVALIGSVVFVGLAHQARKHNSMHRSTLWELLLPTAVWISLGLHHFGINYWICYFALMVPVSVQVAIGSMWNEFGFGQKMVRQPINTKQG